MTVGNLELSNNSNMEKAVVTIDFPQKADEKEIELHENEDFGDDGVKWIDMNKREKQKFVLFSIAKPIGVLGCLYFFICSLDIMSTAFKLIAGKYASEALQSNVVIQNPLAGLMIGVIVTVLVQSSSTSTSIVVSMVASGILNVRNAIPIIMGANIGTSVTSCIVSIGQMGDKEKFRLAFAGANVHEMFNFLSVAILLPLEVISGYLNWVSEAIVDGLFSSTSQGSNVEFLTVITKPLTEKIIKLDSKVLNDIAANKSTGNETLIKHICNATTGEKCKFLFEPLDWPEWGIGILLLAISLTVLMVCLILMVKILSSIFKGSVAKLVRKTVNADFPGIFKYVTPYVAMLLGCGLTILVQSSSVFTSTLVPLVGMGLVSIDRVFPMVLGSNIGTTVTGILAALSSSTNTKLSLQIAFCHTFFNLTGILIWFPIKYMRMIPIKTSEFLADRVAEYKWFAIAWLLLVFIIVPGVSFGISMAGLEFTLIVIVCVIVLFAFIIIVNKIQEKKPHILPKFLQDWEFLPEFLRSLAPYDRFITKYLTCCRCCQSKIQPEINDLDIVVEKTTTV